LLSKFYLGQISEEDEKKHVALPFTMKKMLLLATKMLKWHFVASLFSIIFQQKQRIPNRER